MFNYTMQKTAIIALNGNLQDNAKEYESIIEKGDIFIAADGGSILFFKLGYNPDIIIGDLDSLSEEKLDYFQKKGVKIKKFPAEKDETDGELALTYCNKNKFSNIILTNTMGGRLDHQLANIFLLEYALELGLKANIQEPNLEIGIINNKKKFYNHQECTLSILPLSERVFNVRNDGFKYSLNGENLLRHKTRGISNIINNKNATIFVEKGRLLYILTTK